MTVSAASLQRTFPWIFALLLGLGVAGFWPSYFSRLRETDLPHHAHGLTAFLWMLLLLAQAVLAKGKRLKVHRLLGWASLALVPLFLVSGLLMIRAMLRGQDPFTQAFGRPLAVVDATTLVYFAAAYGLALHHRRNLPLHARLMASTGLLISPPATARLAPALFPFVRSFPAAFHVGYGIAELVVLGLLLADLRPGRPRLVFATLLGFLLLQQAAFQLMVGR